MHRKPKFVEVESVWFARQEDAALGKEVPERSLWELFVLEYIFSG
jgi:hypothetical protein